MHLYDDCLSVYLVLHISVSGQLQGLFLDRSLIHAVDFAFERTTLM